ncbi:hypothetical protein ACFV5J_33085 [Streptomyces zaomyceticus]|uniref:hypothetical protein n=1 Tax=Streptomyces zaomyceticus TaxID=68286 RepID=UPI0036468677
MSRAAGARGAGCAPAPRNTGVHTAAYADCVTPYETLFPPAAVRVVPAGEAFGGGPDGRVL